MPQCTYLFPLLSAQNITHETEAKGLYPRNVLTSLRVAGFQVTTSGQFWVIQGQNTYKSHKTTHLDCGLKKQRFRSCPVPSSGQTPSILGCLVLVRLKTSYNR
jgi:hypothetical protein